MASDSTTTTTNDKPHNPGSEPLTPMNGDGQRVQEETTREASPSIFVNSEPMREDQVQNAVKFLSHPKVQGSPIVYRRSFLEKKGLTKEEIDEAFRRVPDPAPTVTTTATATQNQDGQSKLATTSQLQVPAQTSQPAISAPSGVVSTMSTFSRARFHWYHAFIAVGLLAATGAGTALLFKNAILPRLKAWIRKVVLDEEDDSKKKIDSKPSVAEEAAAAAKAAAAAAADVAKASQEMLNSRNEEKHRHEAFMNLLGVQVEEMKSMSTAIKKLEGTRAVTISSNKQIEEARYASSNVRPSSAPASVEPAVAPHPKSYMEIMSMVQRGEKPPGIKDINDSAPNPNQPPSNPRLAPRVKPWETGQVQNGSYYGEGSGSGSGSGSSSNGQYTIPPTSQLNGDSSEPLWQQQQQRKNVRISEIEGEDESRMASSRAATNEQMVRRAWVPPQPPPIAMAEAATAIRQQKTSVQNRTSEEKLIARPSDEIEELQRITKISESGGEVEIDNKMGAAAAAAAAAAAGTYGNEIQEEDLGGDGIIG